MPRHPGHPVGEGAGSFRFVEELPVIDVGPLRRQGDDGAAERVEVARRIDAACRRHGFFLVTGHDIDPELLRRMTTAARAFFARPDEEKATIAMSRGGRSWRGWFPLGDELTSGVPDDKEGIYFGSDDPPDHPRVRAGVPLHGPNLFPERGVFPEPVVDLRPAVTDWIEALTELGHDLMRGVSLALGLGEHWFGDHLTADPTILFRIFRYPPDPDESPDRWGVAEHTDYGLLTILAQESEGLQVHTPDGWIDVPVIENTFVVNIGDMLDRMTGGWYRSTPHRVRSTAKDRLSFPFFFDPGWDAEIRALPLDGQPPADAARPRWDEADIHAFEGPYHEHLLAKVAKVFPDLAAETGSESGR